MSFYGRVAVITGAGSGIGRALALELAGRGADLALSDIDEDGLAETVGRVPARRKVTSERLDVSDRGAVYAYRDRVLEQHGKVDAVVNNAGVSLVDTVDEMSYEDFEWIVGINFWGVVYGTKAFLPHLRSRRDGWIVNISSVFGMIGFPGQSGYNATKFAVRGFTESLRQEVAADGVTVCCVHPGGIDTNIVRKGRFRRSVVGPETKEEAEEVFARLAKTGPEEAARVIADGMERGDPRILIGADARLIDRVQRLAPVRYAPLLKAIALRMAGRD